MKNFLPWLLVFVITPWAAAKNSWTLTDATLRLENITQWRVDSRGIAFSHADAAAGLLPWDQFVSLHDAAPSLPTPTASTWRLFLRDGQRLAGLPAGLSGGETLRWNSPPLGVLAVPLSRVERIARVSTSLKASAPQASAEDVIMLANGDSLSGIVLALGDQQVQVQTSGATRDIPLDSVAAIYFAQAPAAAAPVSQPATAPSTAIFRLRLRDDGTLIISQPAGDETQLRFIWNSASCAISGDAIVSIEHLNGPIMRLSDMPPATQQERPFFGPPWPAQMNLAVTGEPILLAGQVQEHGIGVHAYSKLTWLLPPGYRSFRTRGALQTDSLYADVTVRLWLDGRLAYEQKHVRAAEVVQPPPLSLQNAVTITLEVDYGDNEDVADRFNWIDPLLLKN